MSFTTKATLIEQIVEREMSIYNLQLGHRTELSEHQYHMLMQRRTFDRRRFGWTKSVPELMKRLELMNINHTLLMASAVG